MAKDDVTAAPQTSPVDAARAPAAAQPQQSQPTADVAAKETAAVAQPAAVKPAAIKPALGQPAGETPQPPISAIEPSAPQTAAAKPARKSAITPGSRTPQKRVGAALQKAVIDTTRKIAPKSEKPLQTPAQNAQNKDSIIMATQDKIKNDVNKVVADAQEFAKTAYAKGSEVTGNIGGFVKDNADAVVASGKTLGEGLKELRADSLADSRKVIETVADDLKALASLKTAAELFELQGKIAGRNFDAALSYATKSSEAFRDLATKAFAPISDRVQANLEALRKAA